MTIIVWRISTHFAREKWRRRIYENALTARLISPGIHAHYHWCLVHIRSFRVDYMATIRVSTGSQQYTFKYLQFLKQNGYLEKYHADSQHNVNASVIWRSQPLATTYLREHNVWRCTNYHLAGNSVHAYYLNDSPQIVKWIIYTFVRALQCFMLRLAIQDCKCRRRQCLKCN